jgi:hypothetical protein
LRALAVLTVLVSAADHWTTYLCLRSPVAGWNVTEANPLADWLFGSLGLLPGLVVDSLVTVMAVTFLVVTTAVPRRVSAVFLAFVCVWTAFAVANNLSALDALGLTLLGEVVS